MLVLSSTARWKEANFQTGRHSQQEGQQTAAGAAFCLTNCRRHRELQAVETTGTLLQVVLMSEIPSLGVAGDLVTVKAGYARNFLAPKGLAKPATAGVLR